jgi:hypothetical protein
VDYRNLITTFVIAFLAGACASVPRAPSAAGGSRIEPVGELRPASQTGERVVRVAASVIGTA